MLLPYATMPIPAGAERRWNSQGVRRIEMRLARIHPDAGALVIPEPLPWADIPTSVTSLVNDQPSILPPASGSYQIRGWVIDGPGQQLTRARALADTIGLVFNRGELGTRTTMDILAGILAAARVGSAHDSKPDAVLELAAAMLDTEN